MSDFILTEQECVKVAELFGWPCNTVPHPFEVTQFKQQGGKILGVEWYLPKLQAFIHNPLNIGYLLVGLEERGILPSIQPHANMGGKSRGDWWSVKMNHNIHHIDPELMRAFCLCLKQLVGEEGQGKGMENKYKTMKWQPIETVPKDGTDVLLRDDNYDPKIISDWWHSYRNGDGHWENAETMDDFNPAYWMPLPELLEDQ